MLAVAADYGIAKPVLAGSSMGSASALYAAIQRVKLSKFKLIMDYLISNFFST